MSFYNNSLHNAQVERLFKNIDNQLDKWNNKYGPRKTENECSSNELNLPTRPLSSFPTHSHSPPPPPPININNNNNTSQSKVLNSVISHKMSALSNVNNNLFEYSERVPSSNSSTHSTKSHDNNNNDNSSSLTQENNKLNICNLVSRISSLEKQLQVANEDRINLQKRLDIAERRLSLIINDYENLRDELTLFREHISNSLPPPNKEEVEKRKYITQECNTQGKDESHISISTRFTRDHNNNNNNNNNNDSNNSSSCTISGPPTVTSTEFAFPSYISSIFDARVSGEATCGMGLGNLPSQLALSHSNTNINSISNSNSNSNSYLNSNSHQRQVVLEQLARRLSMPFNN